LLSTHLPPIFALPLKAMMTAMIGARLPRFQHRWNALSATT
jgi:hypothetical protein